MALKVRVEGVDRFKRMLARLPARLGEVVEALANLVWRRARAYAPVRTGYLRSSLRVSGISVVSEAPYSGYLEFGTRPHMIFPRRAKALRFEVGGRTVFARYVRHPGFRGRLYMRRALEDGLRRLGEIARRLLR